MIDGIVQLFDRALGTTESRNQYRVAERRAEFVVADMGRLVLLDEIFSVIAPINLRVVATVALGPISALGGQGRPEPTFSRRAR